MSPIARRRGAIWAAVGLLVHVLVLSAVPAEAAVSVPGPVRALRLSSVAGTSATLAWFAPLGASGVTITAYRVETKQGGGSWSEVTSAVPTGSAGAVISYTVTGLTKGSAYSFRVRALAGSAEGRPVVLGIAQLSAGWVSTCAVLYDGKVQCVGQNGSGELGNNSTDDSATPVEVQGISGAVQVSVGATHACAVVFATVSSTAGTVKCWGNNSSGQLGDGSTTTRLVPVSAGSRTDYVSVAAGADHTCALTSTGTVWCWGEGTYGQLGRGSITSSLVPVQASSVSGASSIGAGTSFTCVTIASNGSVKCWGDNDSGQFGNGSTSSAVLSAVTTVGVTGAVAVTGGLIHMCAVLNTGTVSCFGDNSFGQKGSTSITNAVSVEAGVTHTCEVNDVGARWCWGDIAGAGSSTATKINADGDVTYSDEGDGYGCVVTSTGGVECAGSLPITALDISSWEATTIIPSTVPGIPTSLNALRTTSSTVELEWTAPTDTGGLTISDYVIEYSSDSGSTYTRFADGTSAATSALVTGLRRNTTYLFRVSATNSRGTGTASSTATSTTRRTIGVSVVPGPIQSLTSSSTSTSLTLSWVAPVFDGGENITDYVIEYSADGTSWTAVNDGVGTSVSAVVTAVPGGVALRYRVSAVNSVGTGVASGVGATAVVSGGFHSCVRTTDARVQCWGDNSVGQLGGGSVSLQSATPLQVSNLSNVVSLSAGTAHTCASTTSGSVLCWGENVLGQIGDGSQTIRRSPVTLSGITVPVAGNQVWSRDVVAAGGNHTCAVLSTGGLKCWGDNSSGQIGDGNVSEVPVLSPTTVLSADGSPLTSVVGVAAGASHSCALMSSGLVWCWGDNSYGQTTVPSQLANVVRIAAGGDHTCVLRDDGGVACWGGDTSFSTDVATISDAVSIAVSIDNVCVTSSNGQVRCFGDNTDGQIDPVLTGSNSVMVGVGSSHICSLTNTATVLCAGDNTYFQLGSETALTGTSNVVASITPRLVTLTTPPYSPAALRVDASRATEVDVSWSTPLTGGSAITDYIIEILRAGSSSWSVVTDSVSTSTQATIALDQGVDYSVRVSAVNAIGTGAPSAGVVARAYTVPSAPISVTTSAVGDGTATISWAAPVSDGGSTVTRYEVSVPTGQACTTTGTSCTLTGLTNGVTYTASVVARNIAGVSVAGTSDATPRTTPGAVVETSASGSDRTITVKWKAPLFDGGSTITGFQVSRDGGSWSAASPSLSGGEYTLVVSSLVNGTPYSFRVRAVNIAGAGTSSTAVSATPMVVDGKPTFLTPVPGNEQATLSWTSGTFGGGAFIRFEVLDSSGTKVCDVVVPSCVVTGLVNGTASTFEVRTVTMAGTSASDSVSVTARTTAGAVRDVQLVAGDASVSLSWSAPSNDGGASITRYEVSRDGGSWVSVGFVLSTTATGLTNGTTYSFQVRAVNAAGAGESSVATTIVPRGPAGAPTITSGTPLNSAATLQWAAPTSLSGGTVTSYKVSRDGGAFVDVGLVSTYDITGLTNGVSYSLRVRAVTQAGDGAISAPISVTPRTVPNAPTLKSPVSGDSQVSVSWSAPTSDGGSALLRYEVWDSKSSTWTDVGLVTTYDVTGLTNGTSYSFSVRAVNAAGAGGEAAAVNASPISVPGVPTVGTPTPGDGSVTLKWTTPTDTGGGTISGYEYQRAVGTSVPDNATWISVGLVSQYTVTGLTNGTTYAFRVRAVTSAGKGSASTAVTATPRTVPSAPTLSTPVPGDGSVVLSWTQPSNGGSPILEYQYRIGTAGAWQSAGVLTTWTITGLTNGVTYSFRVRARNAAGTGFISAAANGTPRTIPGPAVIDAPTEGNGTVTWTWAAPVSNGGSAVLGYVYKVDNESWSALTTSRSVTRSGLANGTSYTITVRAVNVAGQSIDATRSATPRTVDEAPLLNDVVVGDASVVLSWTPGASGGGVLDHYEVSIDDSAEWTNVGDGTSATISTLANGTPLQNGTTYSFRVRAVTLVGSSLSAGAASASRAGAPRTVPSSPTGVIATPLDGAIELTWIAGGDGGSAVTAFEYEVDASGEWIFAGTSESDSVVVDSLENGIERSFRVRAVNVVGAGNGSTVVSSTPRTRPDAPTLVSAEELDGSVALSWNAGGNGGSPILSYEYSVNDGEFVEVATGTSVTVGGLTNGQRYSFRVRAINIEGAGAISNSLESVPYTTPEAPIVLGAVPGNREATVAWASGGDGGSTITRFEYSLDRTTWTSAELATSAVITGLSNGVETEIFLRAVNVRGEGGTSTISVVPRTVPVAPEVAVVSALDGGVQIQWTLASNGGSAVLRYEYSVDGVESPISAGTGSSLIVGGLTNGVTYEFRVRAVNQTGAGNWSPLATVVPRAIPGIPTIATAVAADKSVELSWTVADDGGNTVKEYQYSIDGGAWVSTSSDSAVVVEGLTNGRVYSFAVRARNDAGWGPASLAVTSMPATTPGETQFDSITPSNSALTLKWLEPTDNGGNAIVAYEYSVTIGDTTDWIEVSADTRQVEVTGLANGTLYSVRVRARNAVGFGVAAQATLAAPRTVPTAPAVSISNIGDGLIVADWTVPDFDGGAEILGYEYSIDGGTEWLYAGGAQGRQVSISALTNGQLYDVRIRALNEAGNGNLSDVLLAIPFTTPSAPTFISVDDADSSVTISWIAGFDGGSPELGYEVTTDDGATWNAIDPQLLVRNGSTLSFVVDGLNNGASYSIRIRAVNDAGSGDASIAVTASPVGLPTDVVLTVEAAKDSVVLNWELPSFDGGTPITNYVAQRALDVDQEPVWIDVDENVLGRTLAVDNLSSAQSYLFRVRAVNAVGAGAWSNIVAVTPLGVPSVPTSVSVVRLSRQLSVSWEPPQATSGLPILLYEYRVCDSEGESCGSWSPAESPVLVTGLSDNTSYSVDVRASTRVGAGPFTSIVAKTLALPSAPTNLNLTLDEDSLDLTVDWNASVVPSGEAAISDYEVVARVGSNSPSSEIAARCTARPAIRGGVVPTECVIDGLTLGQTYGISVVANNGVGASSTLADIVVIRRKPATPTGFAATAGDGSVRLTWTSGASNGGSPILRYEYSRDGGSTWVSAGTSTSATVTGLTNGSSYSFVLRAWNVVGASGATSSVSATPLPPIPVISVAPKVYGAPIVGGILSCTLASTTVGWTYTYGWTRGGVAIAGAATASYTVKAVDVGKALSCNARARNLAGLGLPKAGVATAVVVAAGLTASKKPAISPASGIKIGTTLTCARGTWSSTPDSYTYRFVRNGTITLSQGTLATYVVKIGDAKSRITCEVYAVSRAKKLGGIGRSLAVTVP